MYVQGGFLYIAGAFTSPDSRVTRWNGSAFSNVCSSTIDDVAYAIYVLDTNNIYIGGAFTTKNGGAGQCRRLATCSLGNPLNELNGGLSSTVYTIIPATTTPGTSIYIGGTFSQTGGTTPTVTLGRIAYWDGTNYFGMGTSTLSNVGLNGSVRSLYLNSTGTTLYIGGSFTTDNRATPTTLNYVARWSTSALSNQFAALGQGVNNTVLSVYEVNGDVYVGGLFTQATGGTGATFDIKYFAKYNFSPSESQANWSSVAGYLNNDVRTIYNDSNTLYIGGQFTVFEDFELNDEITNLGRIAQIPLGYNKTDYSATGQPSNTTAPIMSFNTYMT